MITNEELFSDEHLKDVCVQYCELLGEDPYERVHSKEVTPMCDIMMICDNWQNYKVIVKDFLIMSRAAKIVEYNKE